MLNCSAAAAGRSGGKSQAHSPRSSPSLPSGWRWTPLAPQRKSSSPGFVHARFCCQAYVTGQGLRALLQAFSLLVDFVHAELLPRAELRGVALAWLVFIQHVARDPERIALLSGADVTDKRLHGFIQAQVGHMLQRRAELVGERPKTCFSAALAGLTAALRRPRRS